jgi:hypothetical protein
MSATGLDRSSDWSRRSPQGQYLRAAPRDRLAARIQMATPRPAAVPSTSGRRAGRSMTGAGSFGLLDGHPKSSIEGLMP